MAALVHALTTGSAALVWAMNVPEMPPAPVIAPRYSPDCVRIRSGCHDALFDVELSIFEGFPSRQVIQVVRDDQSPVSLQGVTAIVLEIPRLGLAFSSLDHPALITWSNLGEGEQPASGQMDVGGIGLDLTDLLPLGVHTTRLFIVDAKHPQGRILISERSLTRLVLRVME